MADITQTKRGKRRKAPNLSESEKKRRKAHLNKRNNQTLMYLLSEYYRWCTIKPELILKSDREVATSLIDRINLYPELSFLAVTYIHAGQRLRPNASGSYRYLTSCYIQYANERARRFPENGRGFQTADRTFGFVFSALFLNDIFCFFVSEKSLMTI